MKAVIEFIRKELENREGGGFVTSYTQSARKALAEAEAAEAVIERLRDTIELGGRIISAYAAEHDEINAINAALVGRELPILERARLVASRVNNAESQLAAVTKERDAADNALRGIGVMLGSSDEWSDQETMIYDVVARAEAREAEVERLKVALADETTRANDEYENGLCDGRDEQGETP